MDICLNFWRPELTPNHWFISVGLFSVSLLHTPSSTAQHDYPPAFAARKKQQKAQVVGRGRFIAELQLWRNFRPTSGQDKTSTTIMHEILTLWQFLRNLAIFTAYAALSWMILSDMSGWASWSQNFFKLWVPVAEIDQGMRVTEMLRVKIGVFLQKGLMKCVVLQDQPHCSQKTSASLPRNEQHEKERELGVSVNKQEPIKALLSYQRCDILISWGGVPMRCQMGLNKHFSPWYIPCRSSNHGAITYVAKSPPHCSVNYCVMVLSF